MPENDQITFQDFRRMFSWQKIKTDPIRGVVLLAIIIVLSTKAVEIADTCIRTIRLEPSLPHKSSHWEISNSTVESKLLWEISTDLQPIKYPYQTLANTSISASHGKLFYLWNGKGISGFPCSRQDSAFLNIELETGETLEHYSGFETQSLKSLTSSEEGFAVVSSDVVLTQFDVNGKKVWGNRHFASRVIKYVYETENYYYLPTTKFAYVVNKQNWQRENNLFVPQIIAVYEDMMLVSGEGNEIQIRDRSTVMLLDRFDFPNSEDGFGFQRFIARYENILLLTQFYHGIQAYDLDQQTMIWTLDLPFIEMEFPTLVEDKFVVYKASDPSLEFYDIQTGSFVGQVQLQYADPTLVHEYVDIAADDNTVVIYFQNTHHIVAIEVIF